MSKKLIAIHSIQTTDKDGNRSDVRPGAEFEVASAKEAGDLIAAGAAREKTAKDKGEAEAVSTAEGLPPVPAGYAPGTATAGDVVADPNAENAAFDAAGNVVTDSGDANPATAKGEAAKGESSTKSSAGNTRR